jgi:hypothetical protein
MMNLILIFKKNLNFILIKSKNTSLKNFCTKKNSDTKPLGLNKTASSEESKFGHMQKYREKFKSKEEKEKRIKLLKAEMTSNPEFFNAFPHLREKVAQDEFEENEDVTKAIDKNYTIRHDDRNKALDDKKTDYFESLL